MYKGMSPHHNTSMMIVTGLVVSQGHGVPCGTDNPAS